MTLDWCWRLVHLPKIKPACQLTPALIIRHPALHIKTDIKSSGKLFPFLNASLIELCA